MATEEKTFLDVTLLTLVGDEDLLEAEIVSEDNNNSTCYLPGNEYYVRVYRSRNDMVVTARINLGSIFLETERNNESIADEIIAFTGGSETSASKIIRENFNYIQEGLFFDSSHDEHIPSVSYIFGTKKVNCSEEVFGLLKVSYLTEYMKFKFIPSRAGSILISFIGT